MLAVRAASRLWRPVDANTSACVLFALSYYHQPVVSGFHIDFLKLLSGPHVRNTVGKMVNGRKKHTKSISYRDGINEQTTRNPGKSWSFWTEVTGNPCETLPFIQLIFTGKPLELHILLV